MRREPDLTRHLNEPLHLRELQRYPLFREAEERDGRGGIYGENLRFFWRNKQPLSPALSPLDWRERVILTRAISSRFIKIFVRRAAKRAGEARIGAADDLTVFGMFRAEY